MIFVSGDAAKSWAADLPGSPNMAADDADERATILIVWVGNWSDESPAPPTEHSHRVNQGGQRASGAPSLAGVNKRIALWSPVDGNFRIVHGRVYNRRLDPLNQSFIRCFGIAYKQQH